MDNETKNDNQRPDLLVDYTGPRGGKCKLTIKGLPEGDLIRKQLQDPDYWPEWKKSYLASLYDEQIRQPNEAHHHRYELSEQAMSTYVYEDVSGQAHHIQNGEGRAKYIISNPQQKFELDLESRENLNFLLSDLSSNQRERTILFVLDGYSFTDIAEMQGVSATAVRNSINRGFAAIRKKYPEHVQKEKSSCLKGEKEKTIPPSQKEVDP